MAQTTFYEVYQKRNADWILVSAFDDREQALAAAESQLKANPRAVMKVVAERFDAASGEVAGVVVYRSDRKEIPRRQPARARPQQPRRVVQTARVKAAGSRILLLSIVLAVLGVGAFTAAFGGIRYLGRLLG